MPSNFDWRSSLYDNKKYKIVSFDFVCFFLIIMIYLEITEKVRLSELIYRFVDISAG